METEQSKPAQQHHKTRTGAEPLSPIQEVSHETDTPDINSDVSSYLKHDKYQGHLENIQDDLEIIIAAAAEEEESTWDRMPRSFLTANADHVILCAAWPAATSSWRWRCTRQ